MLALKQTLRYSHTVAILSSFKMKSNVLILLFVVIFSLHAVLGQNANSDVQVRVLSTAGNFLLFFF